MKRRTLLRGLAIALPTLTLSKTYALSLLDQEAHSVPGFKPTWESLEGYVVPEWFRDAKFGIWAHWGPQCQPEAGDWYAREMYMEGSKKYKFHVEKYGHPSKFGFKDVIHSWKAENWNPQELVDLYKSAGARYFLAMANHHDNFDLYNSRYQKNWNATKLGPKRDIIEEWAAAARKNNLPFGVSVHAAHTWSWLETAQRSDKSGPLAGVPYDGKLTAADGKGKWWDGLDPQELYAQDHPLSQDSLDNDTVGKQWDWGNGVTPPSQAYLNKFYNRTIELIDKYGPEMVYFDDSQLPFWPINDTGLRLACYHYNRSIKKHGKLQAVITGKMLNEQQRKAMIWDIERGQSNSIEPLPWQTDTCIGDWHYNRELYDRDGYKSAATIIHTLVDVVSKNGNLMLNIPIRGDGSIDEKERAIVNEIGLWMQVNGESIYGTRPWSIFGEGPAQEKVVKLTDQGYNEGKGKPFSALDIRFATKGKNLFATALGWPANDALLIRSLADGSIHYTKAVQSVRLVSTGESLSFERSRDGLRVKLPDKPQNGSFAVALQIS